MREQRPMIARVATSRVSGEPIVILTMPVFAADGSVAAVLGGSLRLSSRSLLDDLTQDTTDRRSAVVDHRRRRQGPDPVPSGARLAAARRRRRADDRRRAAGLAPARQPDRAGRLRPARRRPRGRHGRRSRRRLAGAAHRPRRRAARRRPRRARSARAGSPSASPLAGGVLTLLITLYLLRPLARLKQRALQLIAEDADVEAGWPDLGGELGELSHVLQHVMRERQASQAAGAAAARQDARGDGQGAGRHRLHAQPPLRARQRRVEPPARLRGLAASTARRRA